MVGPDLGFWDVREAERKGREVTGREAVKAGVDDIAGVGKAALWTGVRLRE